MAKRDFAPRPNRKSNYAYALESNPTLSVYNYPLKEALKILDISFNTFKKLEEAGVFHRVTEGVTAWIPKEEVKNFSAEKKRKQRKELNAFVLTYEESLLLESILKKTRSQDSNVQAFREKLEKHIKRFE